MKMPSATLMRSGSLNSRAMTNKMKRIRKLMTFKHSQHGTNRRQWRDDALTL